MEEVIRIENDGQIFWNGKLIDGDDDFKSAMIELKEQLNKNNAIVSELETLRRQNNQMAKIMYGKECQNCNIIRGFLGGNTDAP